MKFDLNVKVYDLRVIRLFYASLKNFLKKFAFRSHWSEPALHGGFAREWYYQPQVEVYVRAIANRKCGVLGFDGTRCGD